MKKCAVGAMLFGGTLSATQAMASTVVIDDFSNDGSLTAAKEYAWDSNTYWLPSGVLNGSSDWNTASWTRHSSFQGRRQLWSSTRQGFEQDVGSYNPDGSYVTSPLNNNNNGSGVSGGAFAVKTYNPSVQGSPWVGSSTVTVGTQYLLDTAMDFTGKSLVIRGAGTGIAQPTFLGTGGLSVLVNLFTGAGDAGPDSFSGMAGAAFYFTGQQAFGDFTFDLFTPSLFGSFDLTSVNAIQITFQSYNDSVLGASGWDYQMTGIEVVPAPGAFAVLGAAGLLGSRRRRD